MRSRLCSPTYSASRDSDTIYQTSLTKGGLLWIAVLLTGVRGDNFYCLSVGWWALPWHHKYLVHFTKMKLRRWHSGTRGCPRGLEGHNKLPYRRRPEPFQNPLSQVQRYSSNFLSDARAPKTFRT